ncbi:sporulation protein YpjB [Salinithrix halophila]|uniref:Sporulation protein YpjB n=1 Tax=Salinithrix halophila TaxID=1485204 RepID=A0ABV8JJB3_9BACL
MGRQQGWVLGLAGLVFFLVLFMNGTPGMATAEDGLVDQWTKQALQIEERVRQGGEENYLKAREETAVLAKSFARSDLSEVNLSIQGVEALSETLVELDRQLNRVMPASDDLNRAAERSALAFDAIAHPHQPLWYRYEPVFRKDIARVKGAAKKGNPENLRIAVRELILHYEQIEPALEVARKPMTVEKVRSLMNFLRSRVHINPLPREELRGGIRQWERMVPPLFNGPEEDVTAFGGGTLPPILPAALSLGGLIAMVLSYVGWKKHRYKQRRMPGRF